MEGCGTNEEDDFDNNFKVFSAEALPNVVLGSDRV